MAEKLGPAVLCALLIGVVGLYNLDLSGGIPFFSSKAAPATPAYVESIATPAAVELPEIDMATWFAETEEGENGAAPDALSPAVWKQVAAFVDESRTPGGWVVTCPEASAAAGDDRAQAPLLGALACSDVASVTEVQQYAALILRTQAELALWIRGVPGHSLGGVQARQGELRLMCTVDVIAREGGPDGTYAQACALALDAAYMTGDGPATFESLAEAYALAAGDIAERDPTVEGEPTFFTTGTEDP